MDKKTINSTIFNNVTAAICHGRARGEEPARGNASAEYWYALRNPFSDRKITRTETN